MFQRIAVSLLYLCLVSFSAHADPEESPRWYLGASGGWAWTDLDNHDLSGIDVLADKSVFKSEDENATAWKVFGGYRVNRFLSIEAAYADLGKFHADATNPTNPGEVSLIGPRTIASEAASLSALASMNVTPKVSLFGKAGVLYSHTRSEISDDCIGVSDGTVLCNLTQIPSKRSTSEWHPLIGAGAQYRVFENWALRLEFEHYNNLGDSGCGTCTGESRINVFSLGASYSF